MRARPSLTELADHFGSDKGTTGPSESWKGHNYTEVYEHYLSGLRDREFALLEIGLGVTGEAWDARIAHGRNASGGASLKMWHAYFECARIHGIDVNPASFLDGDRIRTGVVDQSDPEALRAFVAASPEVRFDVIADDGSHRPDHQQISLGTLFPLLAPGGLYFIEDLLANGFGDGDGAAGRHGSPHHRNTRSVLKAFQETRVFPEPHALVDCEALAREIESISFHTPGRDRGRNQAGGEKLCVIRKVAS